MSATRAPATSSFRRSLTALLVLCLLLAAGTLGARVRGDARGPTIVVGGLPDALALDPASGYAFVADDAAATVSVVDLARGQIMRRVRVGTPTNGQPLALAVDTVTHRVFVTNRGNIGAPSVLRVLDSRSGTPLATIRMGPEASAVAVDERAGHAFVATAGDGRLSLLDARSGAVVRTTALGLAPLVMAVDPRTARVFVGGPAMPEGLGQAAWAYGGGVGRISVLDSRSGALVQTVWVQAVPAALAVDTRTGRVFAATPQANALSLLDARSGRVLRTIPLGRQPNALAVDERRGRVYVVNAGDGTVSVLDARTGTVLQTRPFVSMAAAIGLAPYALAVDDARDRVYIAAWARLDPEGVFLGPGRLFVLDARTGTVQRTLAVGLSPQTLTVEAGSGRVVVVDSGGAVYVKTDGTERWLRQVLGWLPWLRRMALPPPAVAQVPGTVRMIEARA